MFLFQSTAALIYPKFPSGLGLDGRTLTAPSLDVSTVRSLGVCRVLITLGREHTAIVHYVSIIIIHVIVENILCSKITYFSLLSTSVCLSGWLSVDHFVCVYVSLAVVLSVI